MNMRPACNIKKLIQNEYEYHLRLAIHVQQIQIEQLPNPKNSLDMRTKEK